MVNSTQVLTPIKVNYHLSGDIKSKRVYLLLHGFMEKGSRMMRRIQHLLPEDALILAPNGPFLLPEKKEEGYQVRFAWYFYDNVKSKYLVDYDYSAKLLKNLLINLEFDQKELVIIGYSQGGYLAPFVAQECMATKYLIGLACVFKEDLLSRPLTTPFSLIHAKDDEMVNYEGSLKNFQKISTYNKSCEFITLDSSKHWFDKSYTHSLKKVFDSL